MNTFQFLRPHSLDEAIGFLREHGESAKVMAGGQSLLIMMREGLIQPSVVVYLGKLDGLDNIGLDPSSNEILIGGLTTHRAIEHSGLVEQHFPLMTQAYRNLGNVQVRNMGTLGGNLCHNAPGSDPPPVLLTLNARVRIQGPSGVREIPIAEFAVDFYETTLGEAEILTGVHIPAMPERAGSAYTKIAIRPMDMGIASAAAIVTLDADGETIEDIRLALGGLAPTAVRATSAEEALRGSRVTDQTIRDASELVLQSIEPIGDIHASEAYRRQIAPVAARRAIHEALANAQAARGADR